MSAKIMAFRARTWNLAMGVLIAPPLLWGQTYNLNIITVFGGKGTVTSQPPGISCSPQNNSCSFDFPSGSTVTLSASPAPNYSFGGWGGAAEGCGLTPICNVVMNGNKTVYASFPAVPTQTNYTLDLSIQGQGSVSSSPPGLSCGGGSPQTNCVASFPAGTVVSLTAVPDYEFGFVGWSGDLNGTSASVNLTMNGDKQVDASFARLNCTLTIQELGTGSGHVTSSPGGIDCGSSCTAVFPNGTRLILTALPDPGSMFERWHELSGRCQTNVTTCPLVLSNDTTVTVYFSRILADSSCFTREWLQQFGTATSDSARHLVLDAEGNLYVVGETVGALGAPNAGLTDAWLARFDSSGNRVWLRQLGTPGNDSAYAVATDARGNVYLAGKTGSAFAGSNLGGDDAWLAKYDRSGQQLWITQLGTGRNDSANALAVDPAGYVYVGGETQGALGGASMGLNDPWLAKYDCCGNRLWIRQRGSQFDDGVQSLAVDGLGDVFITGYYHQLATGSSSAFLRKYDADGNEQWHREYHNYIWDYFTGVAADGCGNVIFTGWTDGNFGGTNAAGGPPKTSYDAVVGKVDGQGNLLWVKQIGTETSDVSQALTLDRAGNIYLAGSTAGALGGPNAGGDPALGQGVDFWFARFDPNGTLQCIQQLGTPFVADSALGIVVDSAYHVYLAGFTDGSLSSSAGSRDAFVTRFNQTLLPTVSDLMLAGSASPDPVVINSNLTFVLTVTNLGPGTFTGVGLANFMPGNVAFVSASSTVGTCTQAAGTVQCNLGTLTNGSAATVTIVVQPLMAGLLTNIASVGANEPELNVCNNLARAVIPVLANNAPPRLVWPARQTNGVFRFTLRGIPSRSYEILASTNLANWTSLGSVINSNDCGGGSAPYLDPTATNFSTRFYRARVVLP